MTQPTLSHTLPSSQWSSKHHSTVNTLARAHIADRRRLGQFTLAGGTACPSQWRPPAPGRPGGGRARGGGRQCGAVWGGGGETEEEGGELRGGGWWRPSAEIATDLLTGSRARLQWLAAAQQGPDPPPATVVITATSPQSSTAPILTGPGPATRHSCHHCHQPRVINLPHLNGARPRPPPQLSSLPPAHSHQHNTS